MAAALLQSCSFAGVLTSGTPRSQYQDAPVCCSFSSSRRVSVAHEPRQSPGSSSGFLGTTAHALNCREPEKKRISWRRGAVVRASEGNTGNQRVFRGKCFVTRDNIDTDQIIPAEYLTLVPSKPDEYEKLGSYAMAGLPAQYRRYIPKGSMKTEYPIMIGGSNFGCGSSREHAPVAMGAAGCKVVVAESYARIFFRNCVATGELYPVEVDTRICDDFTTDDDVTVDLENDIVVNHSTGREYRLRPLGDAGPVIDAGGIFSYARSTGMIASAS